MYGVVAAMHSGIDCSGLVNRAYAAVGNQRTSVSLQHLHLQVEEFLFQKHVLAISFVILVT